MTKPRVPAQRLMYSLLIAYVLQIASYFSLAAETSSNSSESINPEYGVFSSDKNDWIFRELRARRESVVKPNISLTILVKNESVKLQIVAVYFVDVGCYNLSSVIQHDYNNSFTISWKNYLFPGETIMDIGEENIDFTVTHLTEYANKVNESQLETEVQLQLCLPVPDDFRRCIKWSLDANEYVYNKQNHTVYSVPHGIYYKVGEYTLHEDNKVHVCALPQLIPKYSVMDLVCVVLWLVTVLALLVSIFIHAVIFMPSKINDYRPMICHKLSFAYIYLCLSILQFKTPSVSPASATIMLVMFNYCFRSAFCWLNVISFDMWWRFHPKRLLRYGSKSTTRYKFLYQSLYGWGVPALIIGVSYALKLLSNESNQLKMWVNRGPLLSNVYQVAFMLLTIVLVAVPNVVFCILVIMNLRKMSEDNKSATDSCDAKQTKNDITRVYIKLMIVSGIFWILEMVEWTLVRYIPSSPFWIVSDILCASQGIWLFIIYCCSSTSIKMLKKSLCSSKKMGETSSSCLNNTNE